MPMSIQPGISSIDSSPTVYNFSPAFLRHWHISLAKVITGSARAKVAFIGDSTTAGAGAGTGTYKMAGAKALSYPSRLAAILSASYPTLVESSFGDATTPIGGTAGITAYDPKVAFAGTSWSRNVGSLGGNMWKSSTGSDVITFAPTSNVDAFDIYYVRNAGFGTFTVADGAATLAAIDANGAQAFIKQTVTRAVAESSPISLQRSAPGDLYIAGIEAYNTSVKAVSFINLGSYGTTIAIQSSGVAPWDAVTALGVLAPDLTIICLGIVDVRGGEAVTGYATGMQAIISKAKLSGDVILLSHHPDNAPVNPASVEPFRAARLMLARANACPLIDLSERFVSYGASSSLYDDDVHLNAAGYADMAAAVLPLVSLN